MALRDRTPLSQRVRSYRGAYLRRLTRAGGYALAKGAGLPLVRPQAVATGDHEMVFPYATYSPWLSDGAFQSVWAQIRRSTLVDVWRCYELWQLVAQVASVPGALVEVGVWRGGTGALIAHRAAQVGIEEPVYLCDTFQGVVKASEADATYRGGEHADTTVDEVVALTKALGGRAEVLVGIFPDETGDQLDSERLRLVHIDVDVYESARAVLEWVWPRLSPGGVVVFDDFGFASCPGITKLVEEQRDAPDRLVVHNLNGHALLVRIG